MPARIPGRQLLFRIAVPLLTPLLVLGTLEAVLRLAGYGYRTSFFRPYRIGGEEFLVENEKVGLRFFPPELVRSPEPVRIRARKPANTIRIFVLGESAAMGDPEPAYGAWRYLEALLRQRYPGQDFEIINVAMTAINSHAILPIARECAGLGGDLWIVYVGNNEMVGPFGAATILGPKAPPLWMVRFALSLERTRLGQLTMSLGHRLKGAHTARSWEGMRMFAAERVGPRDAHRETVYASFRKNLEDILRAGLRSGARVVLNEVAVNLRDCPPFASMPDGDKEKGRSEQGDRDPYSAQNQFSWARSFLERTNYDEARKHFALACDYDALPFRADSRINGIIAEAGRRLACPALRVLDAAEVLGTNSLCGIAGEESFYEHVHLNFDGNYRLARAWAVEVEKLLEGRLGVGSPPPRAEWASQEECEHRLGLSDWNRSKVLRGVLRRLNRPPLSDQANNGWRLKEVRDWQERLIRRMDRAGAHKAHEEFEEAVGRAPDDFYLRQNYADFLEAVHDWDGALKEWHEARRLIPHNVQPYFAAGRLLAAQNQFEEAEQSLTTAATLRPDSIDTWLALGQLHINESKMDQALQDLGRAERIDPSDARVHYGYGRAFAKMGRSADAIGGYRRAIELNPEYWEAHAELGGHLAREGNTDESSKEFENVIRLKPDFAMGHLNLGVILMKQGHLQEAKGQFEETLRLDERNELARNYLGQLEESASRR